MVIGEVRPLENVDRVWSESPYKSHFTTWVQGIWNVRIEYLNLGWWTYMADNQNVTSMWLLVLLPSFLWRTFFYFHYSYASFSLSIPWSPCLLSTSSFPLIFLNTTITSSNLYPTSHAVISALCVSKPCSPNTWHFGAFVQLLSSNRLTTFPAFISSGLSCADIVSSPFLFVYYIFTCQRPDRLGKLV